jgi:endonuclease/exonuclease/phosphatase family metal-dependent hydrolase
VFGATDLPTFIAAAEAALHQVAANNFPERAVALAKQIAKNKPELVGLQEVFNFTFDPDGPGPFPPQNGPAPFVDHLTVTLSALEARGEMYVPIALVQNVNISLPGIMVPGLGLVTVGVTDRDVILARSDIAASVAPAAIPCAKPSADGCNYIAAVSAITPGGFINIERGFVGVDATIAGKDYRFVTTHLEVKYPDPTNLLSPTIQAAQAQELIRTLALTTPPDRSLILVGDINSSPEDEVITDPVSIVPPYLQLVWAGYVDAWPMKRGKKKRGYTCCQLEDLSNKKSMLNERIDVIFSAEVPEKVKKAKVLGVKGKDRTKPGRLWPSDHGTVTVELRFN